MYRQLIEEVKTIRHNQFHEKSPSDTIIYCQNSLRTQLIWPIFSCADVILLLHRDVSSPFGIAQYNLSNFCTVGYKELHAQRVWILEHLYSPLIQVYSNFISATHRKGTIIYKVCEAIYYSLRHVVGSKVPLSLSTGTRHLRRPLQVGWFQLGSKTILFQVLQIFHSPATRLGHSHRGSWIAHSVERILLRLQKNIEITNTVIGLLR